MSATPPGADPYLGRTLGVTYEVKERIGEGAAGVVYRVRHTLMDQEFAVKVLHPDLADDPDIRKSLLKEARALTLFAHPNAVQVRHLGEDEGALYLVMDLCPGETLQAVLERVGPLPEARAVGIALQVLDAVAAAHRAGIVHRDLKPGNLVVAPGDRPDEEHVRVLDFGLARVVGAARERMASVLTSIEGNVVGTVAYMSPEQVRGLPDVDGRADVFAVGVILYEMLSGRLPFRSGSLLSMMSRILEQEPEPFDAPAGTPGVSPALEQVVRRALEKDRDRRFPTAEAFAAALRDASRGVAPAALAPAASATRGGQARPRWLVPVAASALVAMVLAAAWGLTAGSRKEDPRVRAHAAARAGRSQEAQAAFERLGAEGRATGDDLLVWAGVLTALGDADAERVLERAVRALPDDPRVALARGRYLWRVAGRFPEARAELGRALALARSPGDALSLEAREERVRMCLAPRAPEGLAGMGVDPLQLAEQDIRHFETKHPDDARGDLLRALLHLRRAPDPWQPDDPDLLAARAKALRAAQKDPDLADAPRAAAEAATRSARALLGAGRYEEARAFRVEAERHLSEAIRRATESPDHRRQGAELPLLRRSRGQVRYSLDDAQGWLEDARAFVADRPTTPEKMFEEAAALRMAGLYEEAIEKYVILREIQPDRNVAFDLAFCWQMQAVNARMEGNVEGAVWRYRRAVGLYGEGMALAPKAGEFPNYRGECRVELAALVPSERDALLEAAGADFAAALALLPEDSHAEVLIRRTAWNAAAGRVDEALADIELAIGGRRDLNPRFYAYRALARLSVAARDALAGRSEDARRGYAAVGETADLVMAQSPLSRPTALRIRAAARIGLARLSEAADRAARLHAAAADLADAAADPSTAPLAAEEARLQAAEVGLLTADPNVLPTSTARREEEVAQGRWSRSAKYYDALALDLDAAGEDGGASRARAYAARLPR